MAQQTPLHLYEEVLLLALKDREGTLYATVNFAPAVAGALMGELLLEQRIAVEEVKNRKFVNLVSEEPMGDAILDECIEKIKTAKRRADLRTWVMRFAAIKQLLHRAAESLCRRRILQADEDKVLLIFTRKVYPTVKPMVEQKLIERIRRVVFTETRQVDPRMVVLVSLAYHTNILRALFGGSEVRERKKRILQISSGEAMGRAARAAVEATQAAVMVASIMPAVMVTTR